MTVCFQVYLKGTKMTQSATVTQSAQGLFRFRIVPARQGSLWVLVAAAALAAPPTPPAHAGEDECFEWLGVESESRAGHRLAWDTRRNVMVMFGGVDSMLHTFGDTWEWNGRRWLLRAVDGPTSRRGMDMVYDEQRGVVVLFGGTDRERRQYYGDTWEWDGTEWRQLQVEGPRARGYHAMVYDSDRAVVLLTGGETQDGQVFDTWEWDGASWTLRDANQPRILLAHRMAYDRKRRVAVAVGQPADRAPQSGTVWEWDGSAWTRRDAGGPSTARWSPGFAYDAARSVCVLVSGFPYNQAADMWEWDGESWTEREQPPLGGRDAADMEYDPAGARLILTGGSVMTPHTGRGLAGDIWAYKDDAWRQLHASPPPTYQEARITYDSKRDLSVLVGGQRKGGGALTVWDWNGRQWRWRSQTPTPPRGAQQAVFDTALNEAVVYFNVDPDDPLDLWTWRGHRWTEHEFTNARRVRPEAVTLAYDEGRHVTVIFADVPGEEESHTWEWIGREDRLELVQVGGPALRRMAAMTYDAARGVTVLAGGISSDLGSTWEWDGRSWRLAATEGPGAIINATMTYDTRRELSVMFAGIRESERLNEVWRWNGQEWSELATSGDHAPLPRRHAGFVYDRTRDVYVAFGGDTIGADSDGTWELTPVVCCDDARKLAARCREGGLVAKLRLTTDEHDGRVVTLLADGHWQDAKVRGDRARVRFPRLTGPVEIELVTPSGCGLSRLVECR